MFTNPHISAQLSANRQRDVLVRAEQRRLADQVPSRSSVSRQVTRIGQSLMRAPRKLAAPRTVMPA